MRLAVTFLVLDLFSLEVSTEAEGETEAPGDVMTYPVQPGFCLPEREGGAPELVD